MLILFFKPPHFPRKRTALGLIAESKSIIVAAFGLPIPKLIIVILFDVAEGICLSSPSILHFITSAKTATYLSKFVSKIYSPKPSSSIPV